MFIKPEKNIYNRWNILTQVRVILTMRPKSLRELVLMLNLYGMNNVTLNNLAICSGLNKESKILYGLRNRLVEYGILVESGTLRNGRLVKSYKVKHKRLDEFFVSEFPTRHIYIRIVDGPISVIPKKGPDHEKLNKWVGKV
jgi:hypothetical protein